MSKREEDLRAEIESHLQMAIRDRIAQGESATDAAHNARREMGNEAIIRETTHDMWQWNWFEHFLNDVRYGLRGMARNPGFTAVAVIALALGIGANSAIFSAVNAILLRPLAYRDADRLVIIQNHGVGPVAPANYADWKAQSTSYESMGGASYWTPDLTGTDKPEKLFALQITSDILPMLGVAPAMGRVFTPDEDQEGHHFEVILNDSIWKRQFGGDPHILGKTISLDAQSYVIVGVMPPSFKFAPYWATRAELYAPLAFGKAITNRRGSFLRIFARLKNGVTIEQASAELATITARLEQQYPGTNKDIRVVPLKDRVVGQIRPALLTLLCAVGCVLLISCANVAHMLLARAASRTREVAVRVALGAGRARMILQFLTESLLLALTGGFVGLLLAYWGIRAMVAFGPRNIPRLDTITLDWRMVGFTLAVSLVTGIVFGLAPAWQAARFHPSEALKEGGRGGSEGGARNRLRSALVVTEFALALMLLVGAGLMLRTFFALQNIDPGWKADHLLTMIVSVGGSNQQAQGRRAQFFKDVLTQVRATPGVTAAGFDNHLPIVGDNWGWSFWIEGRPLPRPGEEPDAIYRVAMPGYLEAMGIPILQGRSLSDADVTGTPQVIVINDYLARRYWPGESALGKRITVDDPSTTKEPVYRTVVGVTKNVVRGDWAGPVDGEFYLPYLQSPDFMARNNDKYMTLVLRTTGDPALMAPEVQRRIWAIDRNVTISQVQTMEDVVDIAAAGPRFNMALLVAFAAVAMVLSAVGIYGVMSYAVERRRQEIGIRMALGARRADVARMVAQQGMRLALLGSVAGLAGAFALTRLMTKLLYGVQAADPLTFVLVPLTLAGVALAACVIPALRAARISPMTALRYE